MPGTLSTPDETSIIRVPVVAIASTPFGQVSAVVLANVITGTDGTFAYTTKPQLLTSYLATWKGVNSLAATVASG